MTTEQDWAYLAGLTDGEGYLAIFLRNNPPMLRKTSKTYRREFKFYISNASEELLKTVQKNIGGLGKINRHHWNPETTTHNVDGFTLRLSHNALRFVLPKIIPYLILKKKTAQIMLEELSLIDRNKPLRNDQQLLQLDLEFIAECRRTPGNKYKAQVIDSPIRTKAIAEGRVNKPLVLCCSADIVCDSTCKASADK